MKQRSNSDSTRRASVVGPKLPPDIEFNRDLGLLIWRPRGVINEQVVNRLVAFIGNKEAASREPFNRFSDALSADAIDLNFQFIFHVALFRRLSCIGRPPVKSAILVSSLARARYSKMVALLTQGSPLKVRVFESRELAAKWLGVSLETITPPATP